MVEPVNPGPNQVPVVPTPVLPPEERKQPTKVWLLVVGLVILFGLGVGGVLAYQKIFYRPPEAQIALVPPTAAPTVTTYKLQGTVEYVSGSVWKLVNERKVEVKEGDAIIESDKLVTDKASRVVVNFDEGSVVRIDESSEVTFEALGTTLMKVNNGKGWVYARVAKDENHQFVVLAKNIQVTALGTAFQVENADQVKVKVVESQVKVEGTTQGGVIEVGEKQQWAETKNEVTALTEKEIVADKFLAWNVDSDQKEGDGLSVTVTVKPTVRVEATKAPVSERKLTLRGEKKDNGVMLYWTAEGLDVSKGFKVVKNESGSPKYPGDSFEYLSDPATRSYKWPIGDGKTWHFRVCQYLGDKCGEYSNDISVTAPSNSDNGGGTGEVKSITMQVEKLDGSNARVKWAVDGSSSKGFKVVWGKNSGPTYPTREGDQYHYLSDSGSREDVVSSLAGGTYYFRVCEYLGGACGKYSNEVSLGF